MLGCMKIVIKTSGGIGGFGLKPAPVQIQAESLDPDLQERCQTLLAPGNLSKLQGRSEAPGQPDRIIYGLTITRDDGDVDKFQLPEDNLPAELIDLLDELLAS